MEEDSVVDHFHFNSHMIQNLKGPGAIPKKLQPVVVILPVLARTGIKIEPGTC